MKQPFLKAYKYRIYPNSQQKVQFEKHFGCTRFIFNWALALQTKVHSETQKLLSKKDIQDQLVAMKKQPEFEWLNEVNSQSLLSGLLHLHTAYNNFFQRLKKGKIEFRKIKGYKSKPDEKRPLSTGTSSSRRETIHGSNPRKYLNGLINALSTQR
ncbi:MAG TPA: helix-turn-helix domain-containing protein [Streptococcus parasuis]|nr:helix-turn-helix domain-containing protein [Streptococcus parasuis]